MKRYTSKIVSKWLATQVVKRERNPKPFPGKAPTRLMLNAIVGKRKFFYIGKPSKIVFDTFYKFTNNPFHDGIYYIVSIEFDKGGIVNLGKITLERGPSIKTNAALMTHYHPEVGPDLIPTWLRYKYKVVGGVYKVV